MQAIYFGEPKSLRLKKARHVEQLVHVPVHNKAMHS